MTPIHEQTIIPAYNNSSSPHHKNQSSKYNSSQYSQPQSQHHQNHEGKSCDDTSFHVGQVPDARPILPKAAFFMGDLRDGLPMLNMQAAFFISAKYLTEKQVGVLFFVFGMSQFLCMAPAGYLLDYSNKKIDWVINACIIISALTVISTITDSDNMLFMIILKSIQGGVTAILPPGFNGITLGIVGSTGFTHQVSRNRMMNHIGTALVVAIGSLIAYFLYPNIGALFIVSPLAAIGVYYNLRKIQPKHVDRDAARGLIVESPTMNEYERMEEEEAVAAAMSWERMVDEQIGNSNNQDISSSQQKQIDTEDPPYAPPDLLTSALEAPAVPSGQMTGQQLQSNNGVQNHTLDNSYVDVGAPEIQQGISSTTSATESRCKDQDQHHRLNMEPPNKLCRETTGISTSADSKVSRRSYYSGPSFVFGYNEDNASEDKIIRSADNKRGNHDNVNHASCPGDPDFLRKARTPLAVLLEPTLMLFTAVIFSFHLANSAVLPLVMQSLSLRDPQAGILLSGLCILIAQGFMAYFAKICGDYSPIWGRKNLMILGLSSLTLRCFLLTGLVAADDDIETEVGSHVLKAMILFTQLLDSVGAGIVGTLHILITNDISGGTGRFSLMLGVTTGSMCLGGTVSSYIGQALAQDYGYPFAFSALGLMSLAPLILYIFFMPETLPDYARPQFFNKRRKRLAALLRKLAEHKQRMLMSNANPFRCTERLDEHIASDGHNDKDNNGILGSNLVVNLQRFNKNDSHRDDSVEMQSSAKIPLTIPQAARSHAELV